jgi:hypothetical protein
LTAADVREASKNKKIKAGGGGGGEKEKEQLVLFKAQRERDETCALKAVMGGGGEAHGEEPHQCLLIESALLFPLAVQGAKEEHRSVVKP